MTPRCVALGIAWVVVACNAPQPEAGPRKVVSKRRPTALEMKAEAELIPEDELWGDNDVTPPESGLLTHAGPLTPRSATDEDRRAAVFDILSGGRTPTRLEIHDRDAEPRARDGVLERVRLGKPVVEGALPPDVVDRMMRAHVGHARLCYQAALEDQPDTQGEMTLSFTIQPDGAVVDPRVESKLPAKLTECVAKTGIPVQFPKPEGGKPAKVKLPLTLELIEPEN